jgi:hypothetical protein
MDNEKIPDGPYSKTVLGGIEVSSRYGKTRELDVMSAALALLPKHLQRRVISVFCDSKAQASYTVAVKDPLWGPAVGDCLSRAFLYVAGGHNGIWIGEGGEYVVDPDWRDDILNFNSAGPQRGIDLVTDLMDDCLAWASWVDGYSIGQLADPEWYATREPVAPRNVTPPYRQKWLEGWLAGHRRAIDGTDME